MTRSSFAIKSIGLGLLILGNYACGGDAPPPKPPETPSASDDAGAPTSMSTDTKDAGSDTKTAETPPAPPAPAKLALPSDSAKVKAKGAKAIDLEIKSDGSVMAAGKPAGKISGMELQDKDGKTELKVADDGSVTTADGAAYGKFDGDDFTANNGTKYGVGDDGALSSTNDKGTKTAMGKADGAGSAKRAVLLAAAFAMWGMKPPAAAMAKPAGDKPAGKPGGKKGGKKP